MKKIFATGIVCFALVLASCARSDYPKAALENKPTVHNVNNIFN